MNINTVETTNMLTRENLVDCLRSNDMEIVFTKKDGTTRTMICTLADDIIPEVESSGCNYKPDQIRVFDLEKQEWRSFLFDSIKSTRFMTHFDIAS